MTAELVNYETIKKLSSGAFGEIYIARDVISDEEVVMKVEKSNRYQQLYHESKIYNILKRSDNNCIVSVYDFGKISIKGEMKYALVMDRLGMSLEELHKQCDKKFSMKTVLMLADLMIGRLEFLHYKHYVHRDIKPDNFMFGRKAHTRKNLYIIDFGLSKQYRNPITYTHSPFVKGKSLVGTARYCSVNAHKGHEQSRRDDLESVGYCLIYFLNGSLPWQGMTGNKEEKYTKIQAMKESVSLTELCHGLPEVFYDYLIYVKNLDYTDAPDYIYLRDLFTTAMRKMKIKYDYIFDWDNWYRRT
ncbi:hypothetical protein COBT_003055 [Conglomerata obtusa]